MKILKINIAFAAFITLVTAATLSAAPRVSSVTVSANPQAGSTVTLTANISDGNYNGSGAALFHITDPSGAISVVSASFGGGYIGPTKTATFVPNTTGNYSVRANLTGVYFQGSSYYGVDGSYSPTVVFGVGGSSVRPGSLTGKVITGYQGWFSTPNDSYLNQWVHWFGSNTPDEAHASFDLYPDVSEYASSSLAQTNLPNYGDGTSAKLYASSKHDVIDTHFDWIQEYGIDGVALQLFLSGITNQTKRTRHNAILSRIKYNAEALGKTFYLTYDVSGANTTPTWTDIVKDHWQNDVEGTISDSTAFGVHEGKPVVQIWGVLTKKSGFTGGRDLNDFRNECISLINWFKARGVYVIGGVPYGWRTETSADLNVYTKLDMISPWAVGVYNNTADVDARVSTIQGDFNYCNQLGIEYQPVMFPGFSWMNLKNLPASDFNGIPRNKGSLFWKQAYTFRDLGIGQAYIAMFDEYDESTAIMKAADSSLSIPENANFLSLNIDSSNGEYVSSDFYLRLAGAATEMIKGQIAKVASVPIPLSEGPIYYRSGFELLYDSLPTWQTTSIEPTTIHQNVTGYYGSGSPEQSWIQSSGNYVLRLRGRNTTSSSNSHAYFRVIDVNIPVTASTVLKYDIFPTNTLSRHTGVDLIMTDGTNLRDSGAKDINNVNMHPGTGKGVVGSWHTVECNIGNWLNGKTIDRIVVAFDATNYGVGTFESHFDNIIIEE